jgi:hypothetical protein
MADIAPKLRDRRIRNLVILAGFTFVTVIVAMVALTIRANEVAPRFAPRPLFGDLSQRREEVAKIVVTTDEGAFEVVRDADGRWTLPAKSGFPAKPEAVRGAIVGLSQLKVIEKKTARKDWHEQIDLVAPEEKGKAVSIALFDAQGGQIAALLAGKVQDVPTGTGEGTLYVRLPGDDQTWLARGALTVERKITDWIDTEILDIDRTRIAKADLAPEGGTAYSVERATKEQSDFKLTQIPAGKEPISSSAVNGVGAALVSFTFEDVAPQTGFDFTKASRAVFTTFDGLAVTVSLIQKDEKYWATVSAAASPAAPQPAPAPAPDEAAQADPNAPTPPQPAPPTADPAAAEAAAAQAQAAKDEAERINRRTGGWAFNLPKYKGDLLTSKLETLLKDATPASEEGPAPPTQP